MGRANNQILKLLRGVVVFAAILALFVVMLGAYTRLTNAGLGCPDWPGCYGKLVLPRAEQALTTVQNSYPSIPLESNKAWTEMIHRYFAGTLAFLIVCIGIIAVILRRHDQRIPIMLPLGLIALVGFQAALGMWTVTLKLLPVVVMSHLLGGMLLFSGLCCLSVHLICPKKSSHQPKAWPWLMGIGVLLTFCQIALGGWVSSNYAGMACIGFPQCNGTWWPPLDFSHGFYLFSPVGENYQGGLLPSDARMAIQFVHRLGAYITAAYVLFLSALMLCRSGWRAIGFWTMLLVLTQVSLGIANVILLLPLWIAVAHNGVAALLLATLFVIWYQSGKDTIYAS